MLLFRLIMVLLALYSVTPGNVCAQILSVDINKNQAPRPDDTAPGFVGWYDLNSSAQTSTHTFTNYSITLDPATGFPIATNVTAVMGCTLAQTYPASGDTNSSLNTDWEGKKGNATGTDPNAGFRLSEDGVWIKSIATGNPTNGGAFTLSITGLTAGTHTITTYHNSIWNTNLTWVSMANPVLSRCIISVGGTPVFTNVPSMLVSNDFKCGFAFFSVNYPDTNSPLVLSFAPDHSAPQDFVVLNGFEIDRPSAPGATASPIFPVPGDEHVYANNDVPLPGTATAGGLTLQWLPAGYAISNCVYFGTSSNTVYNATVASPEFKSAFAVVTNAIFVVTNSYNLTNLNSALTYYWRVDQWDIANGVTNLAKGIVWEFRTRHLAFPTAEGYGRWSRGGRGGVVLEVTNLNDSGPGSYRAAIAASGPRTIVFRVSGLIRLQSQCIVGNGYVTIAGQTAPGDGICLANWRAGMSGPNDVIMRFMRFRVGDAAEQSMDAMSPGSATQTIIDHCSSSWSLDVACNSLQSGSLGSQAAMTSYQHNIISEPLNYSYHYNDAERAATCKTNNCCTSCYQAHAFAASISGEIGSYHHNLIAHSTDRNWSLAGGLDQTTHYAGSLDIRNNVVYNWTARTTDGGCARCDYVNNYYRSYASSPSAKYLLKIDALVTNWGTESYYMTGNVMVGVSGQANLYTNNWLNGGFQNGAAVQVQIQTNAEIFPSYVTTQTATNAYKVVLSDVGCNLPAGDRIDQRTIGEVLDGTTHYSGTNGPHYTINGVVQDTPGADYPGMIDSQTDVHDYTNDITQSNYSPNYPWPPYTTYNLWPDSDHDGLPDWWERLKGLNLNSAAGDFSDANADPVGDGYTELERYLGWLALPHADCPIGTTLNVELTQYTRGFTNNTPVYVVFGATNGTVVLSGKTAQFTATVSTNALGSFLFKVTDASGFAYTNTVGIHILIATTNTAPVLAPVASPTINVGWNLSLTNTATDTDAPLQSLTFSLPQGPTNATVGASSGIFSWRPLVSQANSTNPVTVVVTDNGTPVLSATQNFNVKVNALAAPVATVPALAVGQMGFSISGQSGPDYAVQTSSNLTAWNTIFITNSPAMPFTWTTNTSGLPQQFYRIKAGPPLP